MEGLNRGIFEIFEIILIVSLLLLISTAIILTNKPNFILSNLIVTETADISSILNTNSQVQINYKINNNNVGIKDKFKFNINPNENKITVFFEDGSKSEKNYIGNNNIEIKQDKVNPKLITINKKD